MVGATINTPNVVIRFISAVSDSRYHGAHQLELSVPQTIGRKGLRTLLYHLLKLSEEDFRPDFAFLISDEPLRTSLDKFLSRRQRSTEETIELTYYLPIPEPNLKDSLSVSQEWLSSVSVYQGSQSVPPTVLAGSYSGIPSILQADEVLVTESSLKNVSHSAPIKSVCWLPDKNYFLSASQDQTARLWSFDSNENTATPLSTFRSADAGHATMFSTAVIGTPDSSSAVAALGGEDGSIWILRHLITDCKRNQSAADGKRGSTDVETLDGNRIGSIPVPLPITSLAWRDKDIISTGWDGLIRIWDLSSANVSVAIPCGGKPVTGVVANEDLMVVSAVDGGIRVIDARDGKGVVDACARKSAHSGIASDIEWLEKGRTVVSSGLDGCLKFWDIRAMVTPSRIIENVHGENGRCLAIAATMNEDQYEIFSAGSDGGIGRIIV